MDGCVAMTYRFPSAYTCVSCGARYCSVRCLGTHKDTRYDFWLFVLRNQNGSFNDIILFSCDVAGA